MIRVLAIRRMSVDDGPGVRTAVVLKGCALRCDWCCEPESIDFRPVMRWLRARCLACGACAAACPNGAALLSPQGLVFDRDTCTGCGACADACPAAAIERRGEDYAPETLASLLLRDRAYFEPGGGITVSGGEPLLQQDTVTLMRLLSEAGVSVALDTSGMAPAELLADALRYAELVIYDLKLLDRVEHHQRTGAVNAQILRNLETVSHWAARGGRPWIRTPVVPGATDGEENIRALGEYILGVPGVERWELCTFNRDCAKRYPPLGIDWAYADAPPVRRTDLERLLSVARSTGACADIRCVGESRAEL